MNYRDVVNNIINDAKLLTKMTARQSSIFRRKIYSRIHDATETEEVHKHIPYPNKKRKIIDKDNNIGSLLIMYKGLMERYTTFTNKSKIVLKKNYELEKALYTANRRLYFKSFETITYQILLVSILLTFLWMDTQTFLLYKCIYRKYKKLCIEVTVLYFVYLLEHYLVPLFHILTKVSEFLLKNYLVPLFHLLNQGIVFLEETYIHPFIDSILNWFVNVFGA